MSPIFDAMRRSEAEHAGVEQTTPIGATELLKRAEQRMATQLVDRVSGRRSDSQGIEVLDQPCGSETIAVGAQLGDTFSNNKPAGAAEWSTFLSDVRTIEGVASSASRLVCFGDRESPAAEAFRLLGVRLRHICDERPVKKILITSTVPQEGKSFSAGNLACILASDPRQKTLLLEGDLRRPTISQMFGAVAEPGLSEYILDGGDLAGCMYRVKGLNLWLFPAGSKRCDPLDVIQSSALPRLMNQLDTLFDSIIIDSPPILPLADTSAWAQLADGILLVARQGITEKEKLQRGLDAIDPHNLLGVILNSSSGSPEKDYYYYYRREQSI